MAAKHNASTGRPASSPQNDRSVLVLFAARDQLFKEGYEAHIQGVIAATYTFVFTIRCKEKLLEVVAPD